jgi:hypothetical protein
VRRALVTVAVACLVAGGAAAAGWGLQATVLPPPTKGARVAARTVAWLLRYRLVESRIRLDGAHPVAAQCLEDWVPAPHHGGNERATELALQDGVRLVLTQEGLRIRAGLHAEPRTLPLVQLELAGCPRILAPRLAAILQTKHVRVERAFAAGRPALAIHVPTQRTALVLYVTPRTFKPFAVGLETRRYTGQSRIRLTRLTPALLRSLRALVRA